MKTFSLGIVLVFVQSVTSFKAAKKCCDDQKFFNSSSMVCEPRAAEVELETVSEAPIGLPSCPGARYRVLKLDPEASEYRVSDDGHLISVRNSFFEPLMDLGDFCSFVDDDVDDRNSSTVAEVAVVCDPCAVDNRFCVRQEESLSRVHLVLSVEAL